MFSARIETLSGNRAYKARVTCDGREVNYAAALALWQKSESFRSTFIALLADNDFPAFRWETPPVCKLNQSRTFEFVVWESPELDAPPDPAAFASHFDSTSNDKGVVTFPNLGKDACLIAPTPGHPVSAYGHLGAFVRRASAAQIHALWKIVGRTMEQNLGDRPTWLNTAGGGVPWLHVRLDARPKYYVYEPYRDERLLA